LLGRDNDWIVGTKNQFMIPADFSAIPDYSPGKYKAHVFEEKSAIHGKLIEFPSAQNRMLHFLKNDVQHAPIDEKNNLDWFDAHCHLFGRSVVSGRLVLMLLSDLKAYFDVDDENELIDPIDLREEPKHSSSFNTVLKNILKYFILNKDAHAMLNDLEQDYNIVQSNVYRYVPLMFDLEMTFKNKYIENDDERNLKEIKNAYATAHKKMVNKIDGLIEKSKKGEKIIKGSKQEVDGTIQNLKEMSWVVKQLSKLTDNLTNDTKESFHQQLEELQKLKTNYGTNVFPFLATDPRRPKMGSYIENYVGTKKHLKGLKYMHQMDIHQQTLIYLTLIKNSHTIPHFTNGV